MKIFSFSLFFAVFGVLPAYATVKSDYVNVDPPEATAYKKDFDFLVFDVVIPSNNGSQDELQALNVRNSGTAMTVDHILKLTLWADAGPAGFQGMGIDEVMGDVQWEIFGNSWYVSGLHRAIPSEGLRIFASIETPSTIASEGSVRVLLPMLNDKNGNGVFDVGESGIFTASGRNGPTDGDIQNISQQEIKKSSFDTIAPKTNITNLFAGQTVSAGNFTIRGKTRERGVSGFSAPQIILDGTTFQTKEENFEDGIVSWTFETLLVSGEHTVQTKTSDTQLNTVLSDVITFTAAEFAPATPSEPAPVATLPSAPAGISVGDLIKASGVSVYYYGADGKRYVFPNEKTYKTWYADFSGVKTITDAELAAIPIGGNITYRPGTRMIKITTDPKVYVVDRGGVLRWIENDTIAGMLYGDNWAQLVDDVPDAFFTNYTVGVAIRSVSDYVPETARTAVPSIAMDKGLE